MTNWGISQRKDPVSQKWWRKEKREKLGKTCRTLQTYKDYNTNDEFCTINLPLQVSFSSICLLLSLIYIAELFFTYCSDLPFVLNGCYLLSLSNNVPSLLQITFLPTFFPLENLPFLDILIAIMQPWAWNKNAA